MKKKEKQPEYTSFNLSVLLILLFFILFSGGFSTCQFKGGEKK